MDFDTIKTLPKDQVVTYIKNVVDYKAHKKDPNRERTTVGGNRIKYTFELIMHTAAVTTSKVM